MNCRIFFTYPLAFLLLTSCFKDKERYIHEYGSKMDPNTIPYSLGKIVKFENGLNDTITFYCTKYQDIEERHQRSCPNNEDNCTLLFHFYSLAVDLETLDHSRTFNISYHGNTIFGRYWTDPNADPGVGRFLFYDTPNSWLDSIKLIEKLFYNYQMTGGIRQDMREPGDPWYRDTIRYSKDEGVIMFSKEKKSGNVVLSTERWVLVK